MPRWRTSMVVGALPKAISPGMFVPEEPLPPLAGPHSVASVPVGGGLNGPSVSFRSDDSVIVRKHRRTLPVDARRGQGNGSIAPGLIFASKRSSWCRDAASETTSITFAKRGSWPHTIDRRIHVQPARAVPPRGSCRSPRYGSPFESTDRCRR